jgi:hypothetical protein
MLEVCWRAGYWFSVIAMNSFSENTKGAAGDMESEFYERGFHHDIK